MKAITTTTDLRWGRETPEPIHLTSGEVTIQNGCPETPIRIAIVVSHPIQYFAPWYRALALIPGVIVKVFFCCKWGAEAYYDHDFCTQVKWDIPLLEGYDWEVLKSRKVIKHLTFWAMDNPNVGEALEQFHPEAVLIHTYSYRTIWRTVKWCNRNRVPVMLYSDSNGTAKRAPWKRAVKAVVVKQFYKHLDGAFSCGDNNRAYHRHYGIPEERVFAGTIPIDRERLVASVGDAATTRRELRQQYGIPNDAFVVVYAGKLIPLKCPLHLLEAIGRCAQEGIEVWGMLVGEGVERPALEACVASHEMKRIVLAGFINQSSIGKYYVASDVVVLMSSYEPKGQTVPEAGSVGCPAIVSDRVGCIGPNDCARPGENALVYPWGNVDAMAKCIMRFYLDKELHASMSKAAVRIANLQDIAAVALQLKEAATQLKRMGCRR